MVLGLALSVEAQQQAKPPVVSYTYKTPRQDRDCPAPGQAKTNSYVKNRTYDYTGNVVAETNSYGMPNISHVYSPATQGKVLRKTRRQHKSGRQQKSK